MLGALLLRATRRPAVAVVAAGLYAVTDEVHQLFVEGRHGAPLDVAIDTVGALAGVAPLGRWAAREHPVSALLLDLDGALGDTRPLWQDWLDDARRVLEIDPDRLPADRAAAALELDRSAAGNWRVLLERYAEDRATIYLRPAADVSAALRRLSGAGVRLGVFTDAPASSPGSPSRSSARRGGSRSSRQAPAPSTGCAERLGGDAEIVDTRARLVELAP